MSERPAWQLDIETAEEKCRVCLEKRPSQTVVDCQAHQGRKAAGAACIDRDALVRDRLSGMSLSETTKWYRVRRAKVVRLVREASQQEIVTAA
jgi:hypothetical protein